MIRYWILLAMVATSLLVSIAGAKEPRQNRQPTTQPRKWVQGELTKVNVDTRTLSISIQKKGQSEELSIETDDKTEFLLDNVGVTVADLKAGMKVRVTPETGLAIRVEARSAVGSKKR